MESARTLTVALFGLTGFGNTVLEALVADKRVNVAAVFTVKYDSPFPYYPERQLVELCDERGLACYHGFRVCSADGLRVLRASAPDLVLVATFKEILTMDVLSLPSLGVVNFHPSLLPRYRGPCPTQAALLNDERVTGVTAHYLTERVDDGDILLQRKASIDAVDDDGSLRKKLATLAGEMVSGIVGLFAGQRRPAGTPQDGSSSSLAPRPGPESGYLERAKSLHEVRNMVRALNPFPGTSILLGGQRIAVDRCTMRVDGRPGGLYSEDDYLDLVTNSRAIRLYKKTFSSKED